MDIIVPAGPLHESCYNFYKTLSKIRLIKDERKIFMGCSNSGYWTLGPTVHNIFDKHINYSGDIGSIKINREQYINRKFDSVARCSSCGKPMIGKQVGGCNVKCSRCSRRKR